jgi:hypothetical protein
MTHDEDPFGTNERLESAWVQGVLLRPGSAVRLRPRGRADIFDLALRGKAATVESLEVDVEGTVYVAVVVDDDPGRDLGRLRQPGHRFFYRAEEVEPLAGGTA